MACCAEDLGVVNYHGSLCVSGSNGLGKVLLDNTVAHMEKRKALRCWRKIYPQPRPWMSPAIAVCSLILLTVSRVQYDECLKRVAIVFDLYIATDSWAFVWTVAGYTALALLAILTARVGVGRAWMLGTNLAHPLVANRIFAVLVGVGGGLGVVVFVHRL